ncbi:unnamed protein product [Ectocarpus sp. 8 AP-2014]
MVRPQHALCQPPSISNAMVRVSFVFVALVSGGMGVVAPPHASSMDGALLDPRGGSSSLDALANGGGKSSASAAVTTAAVAAADDFLTFCVDFDELPEKLGASHDYRVVAVTGCQCSGKSTLLNALFGTGFPVLENAEDSLPRRTTIGAWIDLQLCSPPRRKRPKKPKTSSASTSTRKASRLSGSSSSSSSSSGGDSSKQRPSGTAAAAAGSRSKVRTKTKKSEAKNAAANRTGEARGSATSSSAAAVTGARARIHEKRLPKEGAYGGAATATAAEAAVPSAAPTPFVLVDVEGTQSRDRGGTDGMEFDSR